MSQAETQHAAFPLLTAEQLDQPYLLDRINNPDDPSDWHLIGNRSYRAWSHVELGLHPEGVVSDAEYHFSQAHELAMNTGGGRADDSPASIVHRADNKLLAAYMPAFRARRFYGCITKQDIPALEYGILAALTFAETHFSQDFAQERAVYTGRLCLFAANVQAIHTAMLDSSHLLYPASVRESQESVSKKSSTDHQAYTMNDVGEKKAIRLTSYYLNNVSVANQVSKINPESIARDALADNRRTGSAEEAMDTIVTYMAQHLGGKGQSKDEKRILSSFIARSNTMIANLGS